MSNLVTVASYMDPALAHLARGRLESYGIPCFLANEHLVSMQWLYSTALGGVQLRVREEDAGLALKLLNEKTPFDWESAISAAEEDRGDAEPLPGPPEDLKCPACGSEKIDSRDFGRAFTVLSHFIGIPLPLKLSRRLCGNCGHIWR